MRAGCRGAAFCPSPSGIGHSDKEKFRSDLNRPKSCEMSERLLKTLRKSGDFQAEYEGSIPFTRSKQFQRLRMKASDFILTTRLPTDLNSWVGTDASWQRQCRDREEKPGSSSAWRTLSRARSLVSSW
jgi:hypothetical protein